MLKIKMYDRSEYIEMQKDYSFAESFSEFFNETNDKIVVRLFEESEYNEAVIVQYSDDTFVVMSCGCNDVEYKSLSEAFEHVDSLYKED